METKILRQAAFTRVVEYDYIGDTVYVWTVTLALLPNKGGYILTFGMGDDVRSEEYPHGESFRALTAFATQCARHSTYALHD